MRRRSPRPTPRRAPCPVTPVGAQARSPRHPEHRSTACELDGLIATVTVSGAFGTLTVTASARAGPPREGPSAGELAARPESPHSADPRKRCVWCASKKGRPTLSQGKKLVIVESPTKMKSIQGYLGDGYEVLSSVGHIRDLASKKEIPDDKKQAYGKYSVDIDNGFDPYYVESVRGKKTVAELKRALKTADELLLATDEDREGEAIAWHLLQALQAEGPRPPHGLPRDHQGRDPRGRRPHPRARPRPRRRPGDPAHPRPPVRVGRQSRCSGSRCSRARRPAACSPPRRAWSSSASASAWRSCSASYWDIDTLAVKGADVLRRAAGPRRRRTAGPGHRLRRPR